METIDRDGVFWDRVEIGSVVGERVTVSTVADETDQLELRLAADDGREWILLVTLPDAFDLWKRQEPGQPV